MKLHHWLTGLLTALSLLAYEHAHANARAEAPKPDDLSRYDTAVVIMPSGGDALQRLRLPLEVLRRSKSDELRDLRVVDATGVPLPTAWIRHAESVAQKLEHQSLPFFAWPKDQPLNAGAAQATQIEWHANGATLRIRQDGSATTVADGTAVDPSPTWFVDTKPLGTRRPRALRLDWRERPGQGLVRTLRVAASADAQQWRDVGRAALVEWRSESAAGNERKVLLRRVQLDAWPSDARYLRLQADGDFDLSAVEAELEVGPRAEELDRQLDEASFPIQAEGFDLGVALALQRLDLMLPEVSTVVGWRLEREVQGQWFSAGQGTGFRLEQRGEWLRSEPVQLSAGAARRWRLVPQQNTPMPSGELKVHWLAPQLVFVASGRAPYQLVLGHAGSRDSSLPLATLIPNYRASEEYKLPLASLGSLKIKAVSSAWAWQDLPGKRIALWVSLMVAVLVLGMMAWTLGRDMKKL
jgi:Protein of unknown function (DUF3999)